jgi:ribonuclease G
MVRSGEGVAVPPAAEPATEPSVGGPPEARLAAAQASARMASTPADNEAEVGEDGAPRPPAAGAGVTEETASGDDATTGRRRRRGTRGGRRSRARRARLAAEAAEQEALDRAAGEVAPEHVAASGPRPDEAARDTAPAEEGEPGALVHVTEPPPEEAPAARGRRRRGRSRAAERAKAGETGAQPAEAAATPPPPALPVAAGERVTAETVAAPGVEPDDRRAEAAPPASVGGAAAAPAKAPSERKGRRDRRPKAIVRENAARTATPPQDREAAGVTAAELASEKVILVSEQRNELRVALIEDGRLAEIYFERPNKPSFLGDIYKAKVENVIAGMDAAFVDFGLEKNGFLYVDEVETDDGGGRRGRRIGDVLKAGQELMVQVMKDPMGSKGARLTTHLSLAGRYLVYVPGGSGVGVSRRLKQSERERLRDLCRQLSPKNAGLIVRTNAEGQGLEQLKFDLNYLSRQWSRVKRKAQTVKPPGLVYDEVGIALEVARDLFDERCQRMLVDDEKRFKEIVGYLGKAAPQLADRVELYTAPEPLLEAFGIEEQIARALERRVPLPSGGNLVIDHTEALTVIDVNTGRFTGGRHLEETIFKTNMEAAREVVRQLRLRDIGGIIVIDFIDMAHARNREAVLAKLEAELETDRTKTYVVELSPLGLVEMTRQNTTDGARGILTRTCQSCLGKGRVLSEETVALAVERRVRGHARKSNAKAILVEVNRAVADRLESDDRLKRLERETKRRVFLEASSTLPVDNVRILAEGPVAHVEALRVPVREGQEVELELEFALTYSPRDAVGYLEGYMVIVEGGRPHLGARHLVRVTSTARTGATAVLVESQGGRGR